MDQNRIDQYLILILRIILGGIFVYAAIGKILDPYQFAVNIRNYQIVPDSWTNLFAIFLPWLELLCGILLIAGVWEKSSALLISGMLLVFIIMIAVAMFRGLDIDCGCYKGISDSGKIGWLRLFEDFILLLISIGLAFQEILLKKLLKRK